MEEEVMGIEQLRRSATRRRPLARGGGAPKAMRRAIDGVVRDHEKEAYNSASRSGGAGEGGCRVGDMRHGAREQRHVVQVWAAVLRKEIEGILVSKI
jgi:hypothetical protein